MNFKGQPYKGQKFIWTVH